MNKLQVNTKEELIKGINSCSFESSYGKHEKFIELYCSLDSEIVRVDDEKEHYSTPICFQICIEDKALIVRTMRQLYLTLDYLKEKLTTESKNKQGEIKANEILVIYVHNLGFDSSFWLWDLLHRKDEWAEKNGRWLSHPFITPSNVVVSFRYKRTIEFRNSMALTGLSLDDSVKEFLGKDSIYRKMHSWDYDKIRSPFTKLTKEEIDYSLMDVYSIVEIIKSIAILHGKYDEDGNLIEPLKIADMPATRTSFVKRDMRQFLYKGAKSESNLRGGKNSRSRQMFERALNISFSPDEEGLKNLELVRNAYIGGLVDNNPMYSNILMENIGSWDMTSQYPKQLLTKPFPCSQMRNISVDNLTIEDIIEMCSYKNEYDELHGLKLGCIVKITLEGIRCKVPVPLFAVSKSEADNMISCGRRVLYGEKITRTLCDVDLINFINTYSVEKYKIHECKIFNMSPVPEIFARYILKSYSEKTKYKHDNNNKVKYNLRKIATNSITGVISEYPLYDARDLNDDGQMIKKELTHEEKLEQLKKNNNKFEKLSMSLYMWAPYITAYARYDLYKLMIPIGRDVICCDTDSIKCKNGKKWGKLFLEENKNNEKCLKICGWHWFGFTEKQIKSLMMPYDLNGEIHPIGNWEDEGFDENRGKLIGIISKRAKCYMLIYKNKNNEENYKYVISGIAGNNVSKYIKHAIKYNLFNIKSEKEFFLQEEILIPEKWSGKLRVERFYHQKPFKYKDYQNNNWTMMNRSGTHLIPQEFSINSKEIDEKTVLDFIIRKNPMDLLVGKFG